MDFKEERSTLKTWAEKQGTERIEDYWKEKTPKALMGSKQKSYNNTHIKQLK